MIVWRNIVGYEGIYEVSNTGLIKRLKQTYYRRNDNVKVTRKERIMKSRVLRGYETIGLTKNNIQSTKAVHRLVAETFIENADGKPEVNHKDGNKLNNHIENLEWVTKSENVLHSFRTGLQEPSDGGQSKKVAQICKSSNKIINKYPSLRELERETKFLRKEVSLACRNNNEYKNYYWKFI